MGEGEVEREVCKIPSGRDFLHMGLALLLLGRAGWGREREIGCCVGRGAGRRGLTGGTCWWCIASSAALFWARSGWGREREIGCSSFGRKRGRRSLSWGTCWGCFASSSSLRGARGVIVMQGRFLGGESEGGGGEFSLSFSVV